MSELLVEEYRGEILECEHYGHICVVDDTGNVKYKVGNEDYLAFFRSSAKPIQAVHLFKYNLKEKYDLSDKEVAVITGSHRAQSFHVEALESIMSKVGLKEENFVCQPTYPLSVQAKDELVQANMPKRSIYHNCSGKHLGIMTLCEYLNSPIDSYWDISNPAQQEILDYMSIVANYPKDEIKTGVDGCGVPVFAMPLKFLAKAYMRMACPDLIEDIKIRGAITEITRIMNENNEMVSGTDLICTLLLKDPNIVAKGGAKGIYCFGLREERLGFAIKVMDGSEAQWPFIVAGLLEQIDYKNKETIQRLYDTFPLEVKNDNNKIVGISKLKFDIKADF